MFGVAVVGNMGTTPHSVVEGSPIVLIVVLSSGALTSVVTVVNELLRR